MFVRLVCFTDILGESDSNESSGDDDDDENDDDEEDKGSLNLIRNFKCVFIISCLFER